MTIECAALLDTPTQTLKIPTEPLGSIRVPTALIDAIKTKGDGTDARLDALYRDALRDTIVQMEATGSPVSPT